MSFINTIAFWGILTLVVPLLIHLLSKRQKNTVYFGSNRFLDDTETTSARSFQLSDFPLLILRMLMLAGIVFALAQLVSPDNSTQHINYVEYELNQSKDYRSILAPVQRERSTVYFSFDEKLVSDSVKVYPSAYTLIDHLNQSPDSISVFTHSLSKDFVGDQVPLQNNIRWQVIPMKETAVAESFDRSPMSIEVISSSASEKHKQELLSVIEALEEYLPFELSYDASDEWKLIIDTTSTDIAENIVNWETDHPYFSFEKGINRYLMKGKLSKKSMLSSNFPLSLTQALLNSRTLDNGIHTKVFDPSSLQSENQTLMAELPKRYHPLSKYFWLLVIILILVERYYSLNHIKK